MSDVLAPGYTIRHPGLTDAIAVHALITASEIEEFGESQGNSLNDIEEEWRQLNLGQDAWVAIAPDGVFAGYGYLRDRQHVRLDAEIYVHPEHYGRRIGMTLARLAESRAREHIPLAPPGTRVVLHNWINALNPGARSLLEREGYAPARYFFRMEIAFTESPPAASWPIEVTVRNGEADEDLNLFYTTTGEAMADHWGHVAVSFEDWRKQNVGLRFDPGLWFLVLDQGESIAAALCSVSDGIGWIDTLAVRKLWRGRGIGTALLTHAFRELFQRGFRQIVLGVDAESPTGATRLYERAGMHISQQYATYSKELRPGTELTDVGEHA